MIEHITKGQQILAILIRPQPGPEGVRFFTPGESTLQLGQIKRPAGFRIQEHVHCPLARQISVTQEVLLFQKGRVRADFYGDDKSFVCSRELTAGDILCLLSGGHGFTILEAAEILEVKQGPYMGEEEKQRFVCAAGAEDG